MQESPAAEWHVSLELLCSSPLTAVLPTIPCVMDTERSEGAGLLQTPEPHLPSPQLEKPRFPAGTGGSPVSQGRSGSSYQVLLLLL